MGLRLLFAGIAIVVVSSAFGNLPLEGLQSYMGLLASIGLVIGLAGVALSAISAVTFFSKLAAARQGPAPMAPYPPSTPAGLAGDVHSPIEPQTRFSWSLELLQSMDWKGFEDLCATYLGQTGFQTRVTPIGADGGIDIHLFEATDTTTPVGAVQCKAWNTWQVGVKPIRELLGVMTAESLTHGIFMTTGTFSDEARRFADGKKIDLIDGDELVARIRSLPQDVQDPLRIAATPTNYQIPSCPNCGKKMVERSSAHGNFWGCPFFPHCRGKLNARKCD